MQAICFINVTKQLYVEHQRHDGLLFGRSWKRPKTPESGRMGPKIVFCDPELPGLAVFPGSNSPRTGENRPLPRKLRLVTNLALWFGTTQNVSSSLRPAGLDA